MCETQSSDQSEKHTAHCHVNHSSNTAPVFSCQSQSVTTDEVHSDVREVHVTDCAYDKILYNITTFTVHTTDTVTPLTCTVRYTAVENSSVVYSEEQFVVFDELMKLSANEDNFKKESELSEDSGNIHI